MIALLIIFSVLAGLCVARTTWVEQGGAGPWAGGAWAFTFAALTVSVLIAL